MHLHPDRRQPVTDRDLMRQDIREGFQDALFIIAVIALFVWGCWVFA